MTNENNIVPTNVFASHPYKKYNIDLCWDDMMPICGDVVGYNVYRSAMSGQQLENIVSHDILTTDQVYSRDDSTFFKLNDEPINTNFYRDARLDRVIVEEDVSDQFRFKTLIDAATTFDGEIVKQEYWEAIDNDRIFNQSDGIFFTDVYGNSREAYFQSKFRMRGNFDIDTQYDLLNWPITEPLFASEIAFIIAVDNYTYIKISRAREQATDNYVSELVVDSTVISSVQIPAATTTGQFRFMRSGADISTSYFDGSSWILLDSYLGFSVADLQVKYYAKSSNTQIDVKFSCFNMTSGLTMLPLIKDVLGQYCFQVQHTPITSSRVHKDYTDNITDVNVTIDGFSATIKSLDGLKGIVTLETERQYDNVTKSWFEPRIPTPESIVLVTYQYTISKIYLKLSKSPFYKVTAVLSDNSETRLEWCPAVTVEAEKIDYMYLEAIRRNSWLLDQTGERVLLFLRKTTGVKCECLKRDERTHNQPKVGPCKICWGTGFVGGYEGPVEIRIAPFKTDQKINMTDRGMKLLNVEDTWTTISPTISQRDFLVRRNSQLYAIGPISQPKIKGVGVQQHFSVESLDSTDIRCEFVASLDLFDYSTHIGLRKSKAHYTEDPVISDKPLITNGEIYPNDAMRTNKGPGFDDKKGRSLTFENTLY
ncbi:MAG: hypothetical protein Q7R33_02055 [Nitrosarchaeum sp.]|nr:hypothetical protein [Nitrosarchaeum sp.]